MTENFRPTVLRNQAYEALRGKWTPAVVTSLVFCILLGVAVSLSRVNALLYLIAYLGGASIVAIGMLYACWDLFTKGTLPEAGALFAPFKQYARTVGAVLLVFVYTLLWTLLLVIPGIIKAYSYSMTFYILRENPEMTAGRCNHRQPENDGRSQNGPVPAVTELYRLGYSRLDYVRHRLPVADSLYIYGVRSILRDPEKRDVRNACNLCVSRIK